MRLLLIFALFLSGCMNASLTTPTPKDTRLYLALGDSYTIGEGVAPEARWPHRLAARLRAEGVPLVDPEILAVTGWTTDELDAGIDAADPQGPYDLVTLLIGVNNQYRGRSVEEYRAQFRALLERAVGFADGQPDRVVVVSIPDWGVTPFAEDRDRSAIAEALDAFNAAAQEITDETGARWVDITPLSRTQGDLVGDDALHPNAEAYAAWTGLVLPEARAALAAP